MKYWNKHFICRTVFYLAGMIILAFGIILNTKSGLGVSPIISVAYSVSEIWKLNFGNMTMIWYSLFVLVEIVIHMFLGKKHLFLLDVLQFPVSLIITRFMNLFSGLLPDFATDCVGTFWGSMAGRLIVLAFAIIFTGIGAAASLNMRMIPNPGDGVVQAISDLTRMSVGNTKNCFDAGCVAMTVVLCLICIHRVIGIGVGTILAMLGIGRVIAVFNHFLKEKMLEMAGMK